MSAFFRRKWVNVILTILMLGLIFSGSIMLFVLPPGTGGPGRSRGEPLGSRGLGRASREAATFLGLGRHDWGDVHVIIAVIFVALVIIHVLLHWTWVKKAYFAGSPADKPGKTENQQQH